MDAIGINCDGIQLVISSSSFFWSFFLVGGISVANQFMCHELLLPWQKYTHVGRGYLSLSVYLSLSSHYHLFIPLPSPQLHL